MSFILNYIGNIISCFEFLFRIIKKLHLHRVIFIILMIMICVNSYFLFYKYRIPRLSEYARAVNDSKVIAEIDKTLNACGEYSYLTWSILEDFSLNAKPTRQGKLIFKTAKSCQKDRSKHKTNCVIDIMYDNKIYQETHILNYSSLEFIQNDSILPSNLRFTELTPICLLLVNKDDSLHDDSHYLKFNAPSLYNILQRTNLTVQKVCFIKVKSKKLTHEPIVYIFTISFVSLSEISCGVNQNGKQIGDYLLKIAILAKKNLE